MITEQQERCTGCRWCCENEMMQIPYPTENILHVGWMKGAKQIWIPWNKKWYVILPNTKCKWITEKGCAIYDDFKHKPIICGTFMCEQPRLTYKRIIPILEKASQRILDRKFNNWKRQEGETKMRKVKRLILGCGSGRCGTASLAAVLNAQFDSCITHEGGTPLPWDAIDRPYNINIEIMRHYPMEVVGDVSFWWLKYVGDVVKDFPGARIVCLKRDKEETLRSFLKCSSVFDSNHYTDILSQHYDHDKWPLNAPDSVALRACFPHYDATIENAIRMYWTDYYNLAYRAEMAFPDNFKVFPMEVLNSHEGVLSILQFCQFRNPIIVNVNIQKELTVKA